MTLTTWTEDRGRAVVRERADGRCEVCRATGTEWSHRVDRSDGGTWDPVNGLLACRRCHAWWHAEPLLAVQGGWRLPSTADPATAPVWLWTPFGQGWWWLDSEGLYLFGPPQPVRPPWVEVAHG